jgi:hypothetical protein
VDPEAFELISPVIKEPSDAQLALAALNTRANKTIDPLDTDPIGGGRVHNVGGSGGRPGRR